MFVVPTIGPNWCSYIHCINIGTILPCSEECRQRNKIYWLDVSHPTTSSWYCTKVNCKYKHWHLTIKFHTSFKMVTQYGCTYRKRDSELDRKIRTLLYGIYTITKDWFFHPFLAYTLYLMWCYFEHTNFHVGWTPWRWQSIDCDCIG